jgi:hypothetical protein
MVKEGGNEGGLAGLSELELKQFRSLNNHEAAASLAREAWKIFISTATITFSRWVAVEP